VGVACIVALAAFVHLCFGPAPAPGPALVSTPSRQASSLTPGTITLDVVVVNGRRVRTVELGNWPSGVATVSVCGDDDRRGTADCDLTGAQSIGVAPDHVSTVFLPTAPPPIGCPCVVRVSLADNSAVHTVPVDLPGVPFLRPDEVPPGPPVLPSANDVTVEAHVDEVPGEPRDRALAAFAGPVDRVLVLTVHNGGATPVSSVTLTAVVGPDDRSGEQIALPPVPGPIAPGEERTVTAPFTIAAPAIGTSVVHGSLLGMDRPSSFRAVTGNRPWGIAAVALGILILLLASSVRSSRRRRGAAAPPRSPAVPEAPAPSNANPRADARATEAATDLDVFDLAELEQLAREDVPTQGERKVSTR
jgi:hypothetical protein